MEFREKYNVLNLPSVHQFRLHLMTVASAFISFFISESLEEKSSNSQESDSIIK